MVQPDAVLPCGCTGHREPKELDLTSVASILGVKTGDIIRKGDPRMNLIQDLIEGDARRRMWAADLLADLQAIEPHDRAGYIERHPYTEEDGL